MVSSMQLKPVKLAALLGTWTLNRSIQITKLKLAICLLVLGNACP